MLLRKNDVDFYRVSQVDEAMAPATLGTLADGELAEGGEHAEVRLEFAMPARRRKTSHKKLGGLRGTLGGSLS